jgi:hypothetical protein
MGEMEDRGYVRMSGSGASFAFQIDAEGTPWLNLQWLADVISRYDAGKERLAKPVNERDGRDQLEILRPAVERVDEEQVAKADRAPHPH